MRTRRLQTSYSSIIAAIVTIFLSAGIAIGSNTAPISGQELAHWRAAQRPALQGRLAEMFPESDGYLVLGPLDPLLKAYPEVERIYHAVRVMCPDMTALEHAADVMMNTSLLSVSDVHRNFTKDRTKRPVGFRGMMCRTTWQGDAVDVCFLTTNQMRFLLWLRQALVDDAPALRAAALTKYARAVSDYLYAIDRGVVDTTPPVAQDYSLQTVMDLYARPPDYVIQGYDNYLDSLKAHRDIHTAFATGILAFIPGDSLMATLIGNAPDSAFLNKEEAWLQDEYRKFFSRGGDVRSMRTLTAGRFGTLSPGEYFFAVGIDGRIRYGRELPRSEVAGIESETGARAARANHAFLFPAAPIMAAGAFFIETDDGQPRLAEVSAQSGHYFYSNVSTSIREDIAVHSDTYLRTLGHFFSSLDRLGVEYDDVLIRKF